MTALLLQFWPYIAGAIGLAVAAFKIRQSGVNSQKAKQAAEETHARDIKDEVDNDLRAMTPAQAREALQRWSKS